MERSAQRVRTERPEGESLSQLVQSQLPTTEHAAESAETLQERTGDSCEDCHEEEEEGQNRSTLDESLAELFDQQCRVLDQRAIEQRRQHELTILVRQEDASCSANTASECVSFERFTTDRFKGDARLRAVKRLLGEIDGRGYERSNHQVRFHDAFIRACSRVFYREEWAVHKAMIQRHNNWATTPSEIMISTPRRFGKVR